MLKSISQEDLASPELELVDVGLNVLSLRPPLLGEGRLEIIPSEVDGGLQIRALLFVQPEHQLGDLSDRHFSCLFK
jgi:hypothetical protein